MYQSAKVIWFDSLKGIGEAESIRTGQTIFINAHQAKVPHETFKFEKDTLILCQTKKNEKNNLYGIKIKLVK